jgi:hypothetical protein
VQEKVPWDTAAGSSWMAARDNSRTVDTATAAGYLSWIRMAPLSDENASRAARRTCNEYVRAALLVPSRQELFVFQIVASRGQGISG